MPQGPQKAMLLLVKMICQTGTTLSLGNLELSVDNQRMIHLLESQINRMKAQMSSCLLQRSTASWLTYWQTIRSKKPFFAEDQHWIERFPLQLAQ